MNNNTYLNNAFSSSIRKVKATIKANTYSFNSDSNLISFKIDRLGNESKFFGYGVAQKLNVKVIDKNREITNLKTDTSLEITYWFEGNNNTFKESNFYITEVHRDEVDNSLSITAYDRIYKASNSKLSNTNLPKAGYSIRDIAENIANYLGVNLVVDINNEAFNTTYPTGANYDGSEDLRSVLDDIAEATQTIYYIHNNNLVFKKLDINGNPVIEIGKDSYFKLTEGSNRRIKGICATNNLGDDVSAELAESGTIQFIRNNGLWDNDNRISTFVDNALKAITGLTIGQYNIEWRGNPLIEIGDKISLVGKDNSKIISYLLNTSLEYNGTLKENSKWKYEDSNNESANNPTSIGEAINETVARVDKANKNIELLANKADKNSNEISSLKINTDNINAQVSKTIQSQEEDIDNLRNRLVEVEKNTQLNMTEEEVGILINKTIQSQEVDHVTTTTGFTFNKDGLNITKTGSQMTTILDEDGMDIKSNGQVVLKADHTGVDAENLHATTYLIVGRHSRFEDYDSGTGLFYLE